MMELTQGEREDLESGGEVPWTLPTGPDSSCKWCDGSDVALTIHLSHTSDATQIRASCIKCWDMGERKFVKWVPKGSIGVRAEALNPRNDRPKVKARDALKVKMRAGNKCELCGDDGSDLEVDHMYSINNAKINGDVWEPWVNSMSNWDALCIGCNREKGGRSFTRWVIEFIREPRNTPTEQPPLSVKETQSYYSQDFSEAREVVLAYYAQDFYEEKRREDNGFNGISESSKRVSGWNKDEGIQLEPRPRYQGQGMETGRGGKGFRGNGANSLPLAGL